MIGSRAGFLTAALLFAAGTAEAQQPRSDRDGVFDGRIPVITDTRGRVGRVEDPRLYFARERNKCERHAARANWWRARGGKNADKHALREAQKAERCFDRLFAKQQKRALRDALGDGTAVGTGVNAHPEFARRTCEKLSRHLGTAVRETDNHFQAQNTIDAVVDYIRQRSAESQLAEAGLREEEDVFAPVLDSFRNRWAWLAINLVTAFIASRVIGLFEGSIAQLVALAALMPIVAGIGGNSGNQTITMIVRAVALGQIESPYWTKLVAKEMGVALLNGVVWGSLLGVVTYLLYGNLALGGVMALAMILNLLLAAAMGVAIPWIRVKLGRDPALGSSVLITACTDSGGFFIFLGLATIFLV
jgi:Mg/Co/Ni transporter MgtE